MKLNDKWQGVKFLLNNSFIPILHSGVKIFNLLLDCACSLLKLVLIPSTIHPSNSALLNWVSFTTKQQQKNCKKSNLWQFFQRPFLGPPADQFGWGLDHHHFIEPSFNPVLNLIKDSRVDNHPNVSDLLQKMCET